MAEADIRTPALCLAAADALEAAVHLVDDDAASQTLAHLADQWRDEAIALALTEEDGRG